LQVASEYVAGQIAIRLPAGVCRGNEAVRSRHSPIVSAHSSRRLLHAQTLANHASPRTTKLYDRRSDEISLDEVEKIRI
jgi:hypothetical protein